MQYHVPPELVNPPAAAAASNSNGISSSSSPPNSASLLAHAPLYSSSNGSTRVAVGHGLLSGRRLAVRVAAPSTLTSSASSSAATHIAGPPPSSSSDQPFAVTSQPYSNFTASFAPASLSSPPPPPHSSPSPATASSPAYGGGIVRISDLHRRGVQSVESGLRLNTLQGGRPAPTSVVRRCATTADAANTPLAGSFTSAAAPRPRRGRSASSSTGGGRGRRRGSGGDGGGGRKSDTSVTVTLTESGELCDYRWFTERGRRCLLYDGRTYRGASAHRMWTEMKAVSSCRARQEQRSVSTTPHTTAASPTARKRTTRAVSAAETAKAATTTAGTAASRVRPHRTSARAVSAAGRSLRLGNAANLGTRRGEAGSLPLPVILRDEWRVLMRELSVEAENEAVIPSPPAPCPTYIASSCISGPVRTQASPQQTASGASNANTEVVEITDSSSGSDDSSASDTRHDRHSSSAAPAPTSQVLASLQWPATSFFDDESSGWSSSSSPAAPRSPAHGGESPAQKRAKTESSSYHPPSSLRQDHPSSLAPPTSAARVHLYNGVEVVEEDGWMYPVDVYASQQQNQQRFAEGAKHESNPRFPTSSDVAAERTGADSTPPALQDVSDVPLADLFTRGASSATAAQNTVANGRDDPLLRYALLPAALHGAAGIAVVVSGQHKTVPLRPTSTLRADAGTRSAATTAGAQGSAAVLRSADDADLLGGFTDTDLADMFVTGEEIGGVRYGS
ncbi:hypothetical protein ABB37_01698 [Leptomonas pyrrhocoris]|uniref:Uncharacterized protein n=1 Tax=Leptomonas pyrrhocoris TaxID=157538 RepID=A0A0N0VHM1_LEPPY|nr:hypothetical protein ABB37_01698 [Leptomonas pyrrhocoris]XP_015663823.1 hypothetical protein ABB37_01698 [Leptomonas pyrrhocoris]KPA85383.1 hypothetical protein ABB37_01698 [Leptomonas pyrrhocoris]KPA85384.1 hypothetical protein ABB37_01698 [Leptomonas pyrrhocoris]|eukprot:XP_015663822.1 hypothetical protein ABB37_01698 [Leptomonas pyrrhocoris]